MDVAALTGAHPFAPALAQYDREIAALRVAAQAPRGVVRGSVPPDGDARARNASVLHDLGARSSEFNAIENGQRARLAALPAQAPAAVRAGFASTLQTQSQALRSQSQANFAEYERALTSARATALRALRTSLEEGLQRADAAKAQALSERESDLSVRLSEANAAERLHLRVRLANTYLGDPHSAQARLAYLDRRQREALAEARARDNRILSAEHAALQKRNEAEFVTLSRALDRKFAANLAEYRAALSAQQNAPRLSLPANAQPALSLHGEADSFRKGPDARAEAAAIATAFASANGHIEGRLHHLAAAEHASRERAQTQIATLVAGRAALSNAMRVHIMSLAENEAKSRHLAHVSSQRSGGAVDLTAAVRRDLQRLAL